MFTTETRPDPHLLIAVPAPLLHQLVALASHAALVCDPDNSAPTTLAPLREGELDALDQGRDLCDQPPYPRAT